MLQEEFNFTGNVATLDSITWEVVGLILGLPPTNERRRYFVTPSLIGWAQA